MSHSPHDSVAGTRVSLPGNACVSLSQANTLWEVTSGSLAVFAAKNEAGAPDAKRLHLFKVIAGDALFGLATDDLSPWSLSAVSLETTELVSVQLRELPEDLQPVQEQIGKFLKGWSQKLFASLERSEPPAAAVPAAGLTLSQQTSALHSEFLRELEQFDKESDRRVSERLKIREEKFQSATAEALSELAVAAQVDSERSFPTGGTPLLEAVRILGRESSIEITAPKEVRPEWSIEQRLQAIARVSRFRTRKVVLINDWWKSDCGPILAFKLEEKQPVALLRHARYYSAVDPATGEQTRVDREAAHALEPLGYVLYRPLAEKLQRAFDIFPLSLAGSRRDIAVLVGTAVAGTLLGMFTPVAMLTLIDAAIPDANCSLLFQMGLGLFAAAAGKALFDLVQVFATTRISMASSAVSQSALWDRLLKLRPCFLRQFSTGDLSSRVMAISTIFRRMSASSLRVIFGSLASLLNIALMFYYSVQLGLVALGAALAMLLVSRYSGAALLRKLNALQLMEGRIFGLNVQLINGIAKLRVSGTERFAFAFWGKRYSEQQKLSYSVQRLGDNAGALNQALPILASALVFYLAGETLLTSNSPGVTGLTTGAFLAFNVAFGVFFGSLSFLSSTVMELLSDVSLWQRSIPILAAEPEVDPSKSDPGVLRGRIAMSHVTFRYLGSGPLTLEDVSFRAEPGEFVAIIGPSGSGKSTLLRLLLGFETPTSGTVYYDGQDLTGLDLLAVRRQLGVVLQNSNLLSGSLFDNIAAGTAITLDQAWEAVRQAGVADDIKALPMGMHTFISEGASNISVGQRQRLLIARALVFKPRVLLFDEATSALDNRAQAAVSKSLEGLKVTRIVIAHRLSTIRNADRIYVIEGGRVEEEGTFAELAARKGLFSRMMARQML